MHLAREARALPGINQQSLGALRVRQPRMFGGATIAFCGLLVAGGALLAGVNKRKEEGTR